MPTPSEDTAIQSAQHEEETYLRNVFASCPPDDSREQHVAREEQRERSSSPPSQLSPAPDDTIREDEGDNEAFSDAHDDTPVHSNAAEAPREHESLVKREHAHDSPLDTSSPTNASLDTPSDGDRLAQSLSSTAISAAIPSPQYLHFPELDHKRHISPTSTTSFLRPGSKFRGTQQSDRQVYDVQVEIKDVDIAESFLCGYLRIQGLTDDHPTLTTFFEGEIIGPKYLFKTTHPSWGSNEKNDLMHWARFPAWRPLAKSAKSPIFTLKNHHEREHLFMRWKEYFLVPDHRVKTITGASFEGFYYICFNQCSGSVSGIYFHGRSEKYQQLELKHVEDRGCMPAMEFR